jgi:hypothetical protein
MRRTIPLRRSLALLLLAPLALVAPARATDTPSATLTGSVLLPDGRSPASAAVVDLSTAPGGAAFARGVSGYDGTFAVTIPATPDLVALAVASGDQLHVYLTVSKLIATAGTPDFAQVVTDTVAYLDGARDAVRGISGQAYFVAPHPQLGALTTLAANLSGAARVYQDPDLVQGNDDLDDPDLIPPLGAVMQVIPVVAAEDAANALGESPVSPAGVAVDSVIGQADSEGGSSGSGCTTINTVVTPRRGAAQPSDEVNMHVVTTVYHCKSEDDPHHDYYAIGWGGDVTNVTDDPDFTYKVWRLKFRTELPDTFTRDNEDPHGGTDIKGGGEFQVSWNSVFHAFPIGISGSYTVRKAKKIHPWSDEDGALYHVSWMSNYDSGSSGAQFWDGGGNDFLVPEGTGDAAVLHDLAPDGARPGSNTISLWTCTTSRDTGADQCDPH